MQYQVSVLIGRAAAYIKSTSANHRDNRELHNPPNPYESFCSKTVSSKCQQTACITIVRGMGAETYQSNNGSIWQYLFSRYELVTEYLRQ